MAAMAVVMIKTTATIAAVVSKKRKEKVKEYRLLNVYIEKYGEE